MQRFKNILLVRMALAGSRAALHRAASLAHSNRARLTIVEVVPDFPSEVHEYSALLPRTNVRKLVLEDRREFLEEFIEPARAEHIRCSVRVLTGTPFLEIVRQVLRKKHDLVMLAAEGSGGAKAPLFGSTSMHLMRKCPCPVWVIKPTRRRHYKRVLAAVDVDAPTPESSSLNNKILGIALSLARLEGSELHVFHAWSWLGGSLVRGRIGSAETNQWQREIRSSRKGLLDSLLQEFDMEGVAVSSHLAKGEARWLIPRFAKKKGIDVIVMGTVCRTGIAGLLIGNTAERILQDVNCSVLALKPDGFATPITLER